MMNSPTSLRALGMALAAGFCLLSGCNQGGPSGAANDDTPTSGSVAIAVDATFEPIVKSQVDTFHKLYQYAKISARYEPEADAMRDLLNDKVRLAVVTRELTPDEKAAFDRKKLFPR